MHAKPTKTRKVLILISVSFLYQLVFLWLVGQMQRSSAQAQTWLLVAGTAASLATALLLGFVFNRAINSGLATQIENVQRLEQGKELTSPIGGTDEIAVTDGAFRSIRSQLAQSQKRLQTQTSVLQSILDSIGDGVVVADETGRFVIFNPAAQRIVGKGPLDATPAEWTERYGCYLPDQVTPYPPHDLPLARAMRGEDTDFVDVYVRHARLPEGACLSVTGRPLKDAAGIPRGGVVVFRDVTALKRAREAVHRLNDELEERVKERTAELAQANHQLTQKNQENEMFVYSVSHDLRSPLVNLQGFSKELSLACQDLRALLEDDGLPEAVRAQGQALLDGNVAESIRFIQTAVVRLSTIIDALLRLSRAGRVEYQWQQVEVSTIVDRIVTSMSGTIAERGATIALGELPSVWGDQSAIEQIFANLIGNALNYLDPKRQGIIELGTCLTSDAGELKGTSAARTFYVKDNGLGIPEPYRPKIFQAFQRLHPEAAKGEGIGLTLVHRMVERHGGKIWLESQVGEGTTFFVTLPAPPAGGNGNGFHPSEAPVHTKEESWQQNSSSFC